MPIVLPSGVIGLDHAHPRVVEFRSVVVVGDLSLGFAGGDLELRGLKVVERLVDGDGGLIADEVHVLEIARGLAVEAGEAVAVGRAVRVGRADEDVVGRDAGDLLVNAGAQHGGKPEQVELHDGDFGFALLEDHGAGRQLALLAGGGMARADAAGDRQQRIGRDDRLADADFEFGVRQRSERDCDQRNGEQRRACMAEHGRFFWVGNVGVGCNDGGMPCGIAWSPL